MVVWLWFIIVISYHIFIASPEILFTVIGKRWGEFCQSIICCGEYLGSRHANKQYITYIFYLLSQFYKKKGKTTTLSDIWKKEGHRERENKGKSKSSRQKW